MEGYHGYWKWCVVVKINRMKKKAVMTSGFHYFFWFEVWGTFLALNPNFILLIQSWYVHELTFYHKQL